MPIPAGGDVYAQGRDEPTNDVEVEVAFGADLTADPGTWSWTDLSDRLKNTPISVRVPTDQFSPGTCSVTLLNDDGALTPLHPMSPYWPNVELGTPLRVRLRRAEDAFARIVTDGWGVADSGQAWTTGGAAAAADFSVSGGIGRHSHQTVNALRRTMLAAALVDTEQTVDVAPSALLTGAALVTGVMARMTGDQQTYYWLRAEFNAGGSTVMLKLTKRIAGVDTELASLSPVPGLAYAANSYLRVRASVVGNRLAIKVWDPAGAEPAGWQLTATDDSITAAGAVGLQSWLVGGNTNPLPVHAQFKGYAVRVDRFAGHADQWEPTFIPITTGESASAVRVTCSGVLRRYTQGDQPDKSPLRRTIAASGPVAYWPAEDGALAGVAGSAVAEQAPMAVAGVVEFADYKPDTSTLRYGTAPLPDLSAGGSLSVTLSAGAAAATAANWTVHAIGVFDVAYSSGDIVLMEWTTPGGTYVRWRLVENKTTLHTQVIADDSTGGATVVVDRNGVLGGFRTWVVSGQQVGGNIQVTYRIDSTTSLIGTVAGTLAGVASVAVNPTGTTSSQPMPFGHLAVWAAASLPYGTDVTVDSYGGFVYPAYLSYQGEAAHVRLARLAAEDGVPLAAIPTVPDDAITRMGPQPAGTQLDLYRECVDVDLGVLYAAGFGLSYMPRSARYNQAVDMSINLASYQVIGSNDDVLSPKYDDRDIRNAWTVGRREGSSAVAVDVASQRRGVYSDSVELNLADDATLQDQASWRVHLGTVVGLREDTFPIDLAANPDLVDSWLSCGVGSRIVRTNPPSQYGPGPLDHLVEGWSETIGPRSWLVQVSPSPAAPWQVATADGEQRVPADGTTLVSGISATDTAIPITSTTANGRWTTDPADFPLDVMVGGELVRLSGITGSGLSQTATVAPGGRALNGVARSWPAGTTVDVALPAVAAL